MAGVNPRLPGRARPPVAPPPVNIYSTVNQLLPFYPLLVPKTTHNILCMAGVNPRPPGRARPPGAPPPDTYIQYRQPVVALLPATSSKNNTQHFVYGWGKSSPSWKSSPARGTSTGYIYTVPSTSCCPSTRYSVLRIRIRGLFDPWIRIPGSGMGRKSASGSGIRDEQPRSYFLELRNHFLVLLGLKYLNSLMRIRDPGWRQFGSGMEKSRIRDPR
jgi:hypothetical protein